MTVAIGACLAANAVFIAIALSVGRTLFDNQLSGTALSGRPARSSTRRCSPTSSEVSRSCSSWSLPVVVGWFAGANRYARPCARPWSTASNRPAPRCRASRSPPRAAGSGERPLAAPRGRHPGRGDPAPGQRRLGLAVVVVRVRGGVRACPACRSWWVRGAGRRPRAPPPSTTPAAGVGPVACLSPPRRLHCRAAVSRIRLSAAPSRGDRRRPPSPRASARSTINQ